MQKQGNFSHLIKWHECNASFQLQKNRAERMPEEMRTVI